MYLDYLVSLCDCVYLMHYIYLCNVNLIICRPAVLRRKSLDIIEYYIKDQITGMNLGGIVAGCSCTENKEKSDAEQSKILIDILCKRGHFKGLKYTYWDSKLTSKDMEIIERETIESEIEENGFYEIYYKSHSNNTPQKEIEEIEKKLKEMRERMYRQARATFLLQGFMEDGEMCVGKAYDAIDGMKSEL
ncbi:hypothetical protein Ddye_025436 [Dipteronia dyeriana]|uniref:Uncharacterized protein n=1 Tax=Dipteronia dyeriana TaxID=168575 RepID=A0AAD9TKU4_9ROSI|nr:hypothetical protein Ddye_025436 [Dipteronia dyeriana]